LRALIDGGSQKTLISEEAAQILRIPSKEYYRGRRYLPDYSTTTGFTQHP